MPEIEYGRNHPLTPQEVSRVFESAGLERPTGDLGRIARMLAGANVVISAWDNGRLIGIARAITDHSFCAYVPDVAVDAEHKAQGIGKDLLQQLRAVLGEEVMLVLLPMPDAVNFYSSVGLERFGDAFIVRRVR